MKTIKCPSCQSDVLAEKFCFACGVELVSQSQAKLGNEVIEQIAERVKEKIVAELRKPPEKPAEPPPAKPPEGTNGPPAKSGSRFFGS